jgi:DNA repair protein RadA
MTDKEENLETQEEEELPQEELDNAEEENEVQEDSEENNEEDSEENEESENEQEEVEEKEDSEEEAPVEIFRVEDIPGIGATTARKLKSSGYTDPMGIATSNPTTLSEVCEVGEATARKLIHAARDHLKMNFVSGTDFLEKMKTVERITTGSEALNTLIGGGVETQSITEAYGQFASGKSQLAFQLSVTTQLPKDKGGLGGEVIWVDTEGTFRPSRVIQLAESRGMDPNQTLKNIHVARAFSSDHQILLVEKVPELIRDNPNIRLLIVDSITSLFRSEYVGRGTLADRQQKLNKHIHDLQRLADRYNIAIYITNQVMSKPDMFFGDPTAAVGGHVLAHATGCRIYLRHSKGPKRVARMMDSSYLPEGEAVFKVDEDGISDMD